MRLVLLLLLLLVAPAGALTIPIHSVAPEAPNTADYTTVVSGVQSAAQTLTASDSVPDVAGGPFAAVDARWAGSMWADGASTNFPPVGGGGTANWEITFTVIANPGVVYNLLIQQELAGAFTFVDDSLGSASANIGHVNGTLNGLSNALLTMPVGVDG